MKAIPWPSEIALYESLMFLEYKFIDGVDQDSAHQAELNDLCLDGPNATVRRYNNHHS